MRAVLRYLHSPDVPDLTAYSPADPAKFSILVQAMIGPQGGDGEESFDVQVCTPRWLEADHNGGDIISGRHMLIVLKFDYDALKRYFEHAAASVTGADWDEVAQKLSRIGKWEFEDYQPATVP
jgi:hypothetical protein